ncbi:VCBS repeat-containing protein [Streptomyces sp. ISL-96]|uniref:FG-GAP repeat domain-containing protein n=1 Tax=Streptomyces sp. ISL-96 TaxID=2819191 RepID=UPI001BE72B1D|nr:VCBS repeat-containing protein [Streptomyces sp. ISL-96]MBT2492732.1 VCBS repeat-containing protein [Streptomyces sp. ISL-96]
MTGDTDEVVVRRGIAVAAAASCAVLLTATGCGPSSGSDSPATGAQEDSPAAMANKAAAPLRPVPHGKGSRVAEDFNGDGHRDLVLNDLVKGPEDRLGDDAGIGIVYGAKPPQAALDPSVRQLLTPAHNAARTEGVLPAAFDAEAACDLDQDGYADLVVTTDPPFNGTGMPPVPLQILFGSANGLTGKAVKLRIPDRARFGNEWPDHPVCGDFDGDGNKDLAVTAGGGRLSFLRGPFTRAGAPRAASGTIPGVGPVLVAPDLAPDVNGDGYDDLVSATRPHEPGTAARAKLLLGGPTGPGRAGGTYTFKAVKARPGDLPSGEETPITDVLRHADFDGDKKPDTVVRTHRGETTDVITLHSSHASTAKRSITFSTAVFSAQQR